MLRRGDSAPERRPDGRHRRPDRLELLECRDLGCVCRGAAEWCSMRLAAHTVDYNIVSLRSPTPPRRVPTRAAEATPWIGVFVNTGIGCVREDKLAITVAHWKAVAALITCFSNNHWMLTAMLQPMDVKEVVLHEDSEEYGFSHPEIVEWLTGVEQLRREELASMYVVASVPGELRASGVGLGWNVKVRRQAARLALGLALAILNSKEQQLAADFPEMEPLLREANRTAALA